MPAADSKCPFLLEVFDEDRWCSVLCAKIDASHVGAIRDFLGAAAKDDPELICLYTLDEEDVALLSERIGIHFDVESLGLERYEIHLSRDYWFGRRPPYLVHTNFELPLLLDGTKQLAVMSGETPPDEFPGESAFDRWVAEGLLHKEVVFEPFDHPRLRGIRTAYYTRKGEEWRIPAFKLLRRSAVDGWNDTLERLEGMLYGYEDWQNDWWIKHAGGVHGLPLCCACSVEDLSRIEATGFKALPPSDADSIRIASDTPENRDALWRELACTQKESVMVRFRVPGRAIMDIVDLREGGPWIFPADRIPQLNHAITGHIEIIGRR